MLKKKERLTKKEFDRFFSLGKRLHSPFFTIVYTKSDNFHGAVVVGKKVFKNAVDRNLLRRRLYNSLYKLSRADNLKGVYIILSKPQAAKMSFFDLYQEMKTITDSIK